MKMGDIVGARPHLMRCCWLKARHRGGLRRHEYYSGRSLAAAKLHILVTHIEAGLRSYDN